MLSPKRTKYRKQHKGRIHGAAKRATSLDFGAFGLKAMEPERITARQIEAARRATRHMRRAGRVWIRHFPIFRYRPNRRKSGWRRQGFAGVWVCRVKPGRIMFEIDGVTREVAREALALAAAKLPIRTRSSRASARGVGQ